MLSIERILPRARAQYPDQPAINTGSAWLTYDQLGRRVDALAAALSSLGLARGDRVALLDVNSPICLECYFACAHAGYVFVPLNSRLAVPELAYILKDCAATVLIAAPPFFVTVESLREQSPALKTVIGTASGLAGAPAYEDLIAKHRGEPAAPPWEAAPDAVAQIYYTSGTTGEPKGVCLTYGNMSTSAVDTIIGLGMDWDDCWLHAAPLFHLVSACAVFAMPLLGARQVALPFSPDGFLHAIEQWRVTATALPPTLINLICSRPDVAASDLSSLRLIMYGGSPMPRGVISKAFEVLPTSYMHAYGITETSGIVTLLRSDEILPVGSGGENKAYGSAGHPVPDINVEIMDDTGTIIKTAGQVGEIVVSGPRVMSGYWNKPKATADAIMDGWYHTGDLGYLDSQRHLYVVDRKKDMIISGGENVYSVEVENILSTHPDVLECAVIGIPSDDWGEAVHAVIVTRDKRDVSADDIATFCRGKIANYKIPKSISIAADPLPKTGPGKIAKRLIRDAFWQGQKTKI
jgi:long-chain acyl-CoA synthetase